MLNYRKTIRQERIKYIKNTPGETPETGCFSEHINILRGFTKSLHVISSISER